MRGTVDTGEQERQEIALLPLPATSLIVCSRNRPELLLRCVLSILNGDVVPTELIIVDQSTVSDTTMESLTTERPCIIRYLWSREVGISRARNTGIAAAVNDLLVFTDDDVLVTSTWFDFLVRALLYAGQRSVVTGRVLPTDTPGGFAPSTKVDDTPAVYTGRLAADVLYPLNMAMSRSTIHEVGIFDERLGPGTSFPAAEDNDFCFRLLEAGYRIIYVPEAVLYHRAWRVARDYLALRWGYGHGQGAYYAKHLNLRDRYMLKRLVRSTIVHLYHGVRSLRRHPRHAAGNIVYTLGMLSGAVRWLLTQRRMR